VEARATRQTLTRRELAAVDPEFAAQLARLEYRREGV